MQVYTLPDISPNGTAVALFPALPQQAVWVTIAAPSTNSADARYGDSNVSSSRGATIPKGTSQTLFRADYQQQGYDLSRTYVWASGSDKLTITYAQ